MSRLPWAVVVIALACIALFAAEPWKTKKPGDWTDKEAEKILKDSPWAKAVSVSVGDTMSAGRSGGRGGGRRGGGISTPADSSISADEGMGGGARGGEPSTMESASPRSMLVVVRWESALPIRHAGARRDILAGKLKQEEAEQRLNAKPEVYVIGVSGLPMPMLGGVSPEKIKASSFLKPDKGDPIKLQNLQKTKSERPDIFFVFPRSAIATDCKTVEFVTTLGRIEIRKKFALKDMAYDGKTEM